MRRLRGTTKDARCPEFSPDGKRIAYVPDEKDGSSSLFVIRTDGRRNRRLLTGNDYQDPHSLQCGCASRQPIR